MSNALTAATVMLTFLSRADGMLPKLEASNSCPRCLHLNPEPYLYPFRAEGMLPSKKPVIAVTAVRTGCGKSQVAKLVITAAQENGKKVVLVRHPMPYGDLVKQKVQRYATLEDLKKNETTIEEREEYEQHIKNGVIVYVGVDYEAILREAEEEADVVLWDGGNNDLPFYKPGRGGGRREGRGGAGKEGEIFWGGGEARWAGKEGGGDWGEGGGAGGWAKSRGG